MERRRKGTEDGLKSVQCTSATVSLLPVASPVEYISGMWHFTREPGNSTQATSTPGHLFHYMLRGDYLLRTNRREYRVKKGDLIYYFGSEEVTCRWDRGGVEMLSLAFHAPALTPLPLETRVVRAGAEIGLLFRALYSSFTRRSEQPGTLPLFAQLHQLLAAIGMLQGSTVKAGGSEGWPALEEELRRERRFRASLDELAALAHCSRASLVRRCRAATGMSPQKRLQEIRMAEAKGLLLYSHLNVGGVAKALGYPRQHEFTREFTACFGYPPSRECG